MIIIIIIIFYRVRILDIKICIDRATHRQKRTHAMRARKHAQHTRKHTYTYCSVIAVIPSV